MLDQIVIEIINTSDDFDDEGQVEYHSPPLDYMRQMFSVEHLSPSIPGIPFFSDVTQEPAPIEIIERRQSSGIDNYPLTVRIDPGYSFGDGRHATTWLCVKFLVEHLADLPRVNRSKLTLLDAGTGTGVLSITAYKLGIHDIDAIDIYHHAIQCAKNNCLLNSCECIRLHESDLSAFKPAKKYDIIMANLVTDVIIANLKTLVDLIIPGGVMIASGISSGKNNIAREYFKQYQLDIIDETGKDGWFGFYLRRAQR